MGVGFEQIKEAAKAMWSLGDYSLMATFLDPAARDLVDACGISSGREVLDVATGNGNCAIAAARKGARVVASDLTRAMLDLGRERTVTEAFDIEWTEADAEDLPFVDGRFDCVTSVFGAMVAPRQELVASELFRVVRSGGTVGMANWTQESFMKKMGEVGSKIHASLSSRSPGCVPLGRGGFCQVNVRGDGLLGPTRTAHPDMGVRVLG
jgi:ubiquinone/menaquinone biosynthesis C-methylase UbiE